MCIIDRVLWSLGIDGNRIIEEYHNQSIIDHCFGALCLYRNMVIGVSWLMGLEVLGLWWRILF